MYALALGQQGYGYATSGAGARPGKGKGKGFSNFAPVQSNPNANSPDEWAVQFHWNDNELFWNMSGCCNITDDFFDWVQDAFTQKKSYCGDLKAKEIDFSKCQLDNDKLDKLISVLEQFEVQAVKFKFFGNQISLADSLIRYFQSGLAGELREVHLSHNQLDDTACYNIIDSSVSVFGARTQALWLRIEHNPVTNAEGVTENFGPLVCKCVRPSAAESGAAVALHLSFYQVGKTTPVNNVHNMANQVVQQMAQQQTGFGPIQTSKTPSSSWTPISQVMQQNKQANTAPSRSGPKMSPIASTNTTSSGGGIVTPQVQRQVQMHAAAVRRQIPVPPARPSSKAAGVKASRQTTNQQSGNAPTTSNATMSPRPRPMNNVATMGHQYDGAALTNYQAMLHGQHAQFGLGVQQQTYGFPMRTPTQPPMGMPMPFYVPPPGMPMPVIPNPSASGGSTNGVSQRVSSGVGGRTSALSRDPTMNTFASNSNNTTNEKTGAHVKPAQQKTNTGKGASSGKSASTAGFKPIKIPPGGVPGKKRPSKGAEAASSDAKRQRIILTQNKGATPSSPTAQPVNLLNKIPVPPKKPLPPPAAVSAGRNSPVRPTPKSALRKKSMM